MNTHPLGRLYDQLTPRERLPLLMAAHLSKPSVRRRTGFSVRTTSHRPCLLGLGTSDPYETV
jgi:hypothetical protein